MMDYSDAANEDFLYGLVAAGKTYFAARASGLYYSQDGQSWRLATETLDFQLAYSATAVAAVVTDTGTLSIFMGLAGGLLLSKDGGKSWRSANLPNPPPVISSLVISPNFWRDGVLLAGTLEDGVLRTTDQGNNWHTWNFGLLDLSVMSLAISPRYYEDETVFAGTESGLFRSTNGGRAWREVESPSGFDPVMSLALSPGWEEGSDETIFAGTETQGLYQSNDRGNNWTRLGASTLQESIQSICLSPAFTEDESLIVVAGGKVHLSVDGGENWNSLWDEITQDQLAAVVLAPDGMHAGQTALLGLADGRIIPTKFPGTEG